MPIKYCLLSLYLLVLVTNIHAQIYVDPHGDDQNTGSYAKPVKSFERAKQLVQLSASTNIIHVVFKPGIYYLPETVKFTDKDNKGKKVIYEAEQEGAAVISGGQKLSLQWKPYSKNIFVAEVDIQGSIDQLFINGQRQRMARFPNAGSGKSVYDAWDLNHSVAYDSLNDALLKTRVKNWKNPQGGFVHAMHSALWGDMHWVITGKIRDSLLIEGGWQNNRPSKMHPVYRMVENIFEELDAPGEWFYNADEHRLYCYPLAGIDLNHASIETVRLKHLIEFNGTVQHPVNNIHLKGFVFKHAARTFMENKEPLQRSDWTVYRGGAILFNGAVNCSVSDCEFSNLGGNSIFVNNYNEQISINRCHIHHSGASGILFVGDSSSIRSPLYGYVKRDYASMDTVKGPRNNNYPRNCLVEDCLIHETGRDEKQTAGIHISVSANIHINHCSIYDMPRAGININEGSFGGHVIENSDIFNTVLETGDHGSFNSWGRDRYWTGDGREVAEKLKNNPDWFLLDMMAPNIIRHNRWRCDFGWDIDLDDGSSHYRIYNNVLLSHGLKLREGYDRIVFNNIIINNSLHPHVWFPNSGDVFKHNIVFSAYRPAIMNKIIPDNGKWGSRIDSNFFVCDAAQMHRFLKNGCDSNSVNGSPLFVNAPVGDYRVNINSKALQTGFVNFSTIDFGVRNASLKKKAKQPLLPAVQVFSETSSFQQTNLIRWMDATITDPKGEELSAYGLGYDQGGVALISIDKNSGLLKSGFKKGDLIQSVNGVTIRKTEDLRNFLNRQTNHSANYVFDCIRDQKKIRLEFIGNIEKIAQ